MPTTITDRNEPYIITDTLSPEQAAQLTAEFIGKQLGKGKAEFAGDDATKKKNRVYGILHYNTPDGQYTGLFKNLTDGLKKYKITAKADHGGVTSSPFTLTVNDTRASSFKRTTISKPAVTKASTFKRTTIRKTAKKATAFKRSSARKSAKRR